MAKITQAPNNPFACASNGPKALQPQALESVLTGTHVPAPTGQTNWAESIALSQGVQPR